MKHLRQKNGFTPLEVKEPRGKSEKNKPLTGFTILELIITIAVLSVGMLSVFGIFYSLSSLSYTASSRLTAIYLAQEGLEIIRNIRDNNFIAAVVWSTGLTNCTAGCQADYKTGTAVEAAPNQLQAYSGANFLKINSDGFYSYDAGTATIFTRKITITQPMGTDTMKVDVQIFWNYNNQPLSFQAIGYLYNWH